MITFHQAGVSYLDSVTAHIVLRVTGNVQMYLTFC